MIVLLYLILGAGLGTGMLLYFEGKIRVKDLSVIAISALFRPLAVVLAPFIIIGHYIEENGDNVLFGKDED